MMFYFKETKSINKEHCQAKLQPSEVTMKKTITTSGNNVEMKSKQLKMRSLEESNNKSRSIKKLDFITRLPLELVTDIMKYFEPYELIRLFSISNAWRNILLGTPALWSTWNINTGNYYWEYPNILKVLPRVACYISELNLWYSTRLKYLTEKLFDHISYGNLNNLTTLELHNCYMSDQTVFRIPTTALIKLANTLKKLEIAYDEYVGFRALAQNHNNNEENQQVTMNTELFTSVWNSSYLAFDQFQPLTTVLSICHQLEYIRYVNPLYFDRLPSPSRSINSMHNDVNPLYTSLRHLDIETGNIAFLDHILKQCPNLHILRLQSLKSNTDPSVLDSIRRYCPQLEQLSVDYHYDIVYWGYFYYNCRHPLSMFNNSSETTRRKTQLLPLPQLSSSSTLKQLHVTINDTNHAIPFLNEHADTLERMSLSLQRNYPGMLSPVWQMSRLVSLVVSCVEYPEAVATLLSKLPSLQNLEFYNSRIKGIELMNALKRVNTLQQLTISDGTSADIVEMIDLFNCYAKASIVTTAASEKREGINDDFNYGLQQQIGPEKLTHVSLVGCNFISNSVLEALGNIKTLTAVSIGYAPGITLEGMNAFCEQLNLLPELSSIAFSGLLCVNDYILSILVSSSTSTLKTLIVYSLMNVSRKALDQLSKKKSVSLMACNCGTHD